MKRWLLFFLTFALSCAIHAKDFSIPKDCKQLVIGIVPDWCGSDITLQRWVKTSEGWHPYEKSWSGKIGRDGIAWGRGLHPDMLYRSDMPPKVEGDWKTPAGVFELGSVYGYESKFSERTRMHYYQITDRDLWVEDPTSIYYNMHLKINKGFELTEWQKKQRMKLEDPAHSLKLFIKHNYLPKIQLGAGSSIFFHIWREQGKKPTSGCTTMSRENLVKLISWLDRSKHPLYIVLSDSLYKEFQSPWHLP